MKIGLTIILSILLVSCIKDKYTVVVADLQNTTKHNIKIISFKNGTVTPNDTVILSQNATFRIAETTLSGEIENPGFSSDLSVALTILL